MSTFGGKIQEIETISIDRFTGENLCSEAFFLSHCHTDHMEGIFRDEFKNQLKDNNKILYASQISCKILEQMEVCSKCHLMALELMVPTTIYLKDAQFTVTLIPAGHCPGSVMFLFESNKRILYTGDYRIRKSDIRKFNCFFDKEGKIKVIDKIYLDTTFFHKKFFSFPRREESLREICEIIEDWINKGKDFHIYLDTSAKYGYEYLFKEIYMKIGMPIHVNYNANKLYSLVPEMDCAVTLNSDITQLHSHCFGWKQTCYFNDSNLKTIRVSALRWEQEELALGISEYKSGIHYVCYSTHASYEEGIELIRFLRPNAIEVCVKHQDPQLNREMSDEIDELVKEFHVEKRTKIMPKLFNTERNRKKLKSTKRRSTSQILNSPPRTSSVQGCEIKSENISYQVSASGEKCIIESTSKEEFLSVALFEIDKQDNNNLSLPLEHIASSPETDLSVKRSIDTVDEAEIMNVLKPLKQKEEVEDSVLFNLIFTPPETSTTSEGVKDLEVDKMTDNLKEEEEDSVILKIINSSHDSER
ncbi:unnamed protein product [Diabrotica balteata]|uniref:Artemis n=1 Tax=Diabrotica balteata TaxID=107213 RepID=A0A9N9XCH8_DIABA|nr:unnamed protein product [Diabrotica balteata]